MADEVWACSACRSINKPKANRAVLQSNLDWFAHYLWSEPYPKDSPILGSSELEAPK